MRKQDILLWSPPRNWINVCLCVIIIITIFSHIHRWFPWLTVVTKHLLWYWFSIYLLPTLCLDGLPRWYNGKQNTCQCRRRKRFRFNPWVGKIPWRRKWQPTLVFLPGKFHGHRGLLGYSPWVRKELDTTEQLSAHTHMCTHTHTHTHTHTLWLKPCWSLSKVFNPQHG